MKFHAIFKCKCKSQDLNPDRRITVSYSCCSQNYGVKHRDDNCMSKKNDRNLKTCDIYQPGLGQGGGSYFSPLLLIERKPLSQQWHHYRLNMDTNLDFSYVLAKAVYFFIFFYLVNSVVITYY